MLPAKKVTIMTRIKWAGFRKSQAEELQQKLKSFVDKLEALVPVPALGMQQRAESVDLCHGRRTINLEKPTPTDKFREITGYEARNTSGMEIIRSLDSRRKRKFRKARQLRIQHLQRRGVKETTGHVARTVRDQHAKDILLGWYGVQMAAYGSAAGSLFFFFFLD
ncbi:hypothetical protein FPQ18DRAFT_310886 [Pyronema domesticum]|nr:hypothetical protein FPQ18DRAFT_310886 [Pyronema domesticum]